jgi:hypothetical protein
MEGQAVLGPLSFPRSPRRGFDDSTALNVGVWARLTAMDWTWQRGC